MNFPIVLFPPDLKNARFATPSLPVFTESAPRIPGADPTMINWGLLGLEAALTGILCQFLGWGWAIPAIAVLALQAWNDRRAYPSRLATHAQHKRNYPKKLRIYEQTKQQFEQKLKSAQSPESLALHRRKVIREALRRTRSHDKINYQAKRGASEYKFGQFLQQYFPGKIHVGSAIEIPGFVHPYTVDFAYIDTSLNLHIDIEIDEPYVFSTGEPIHFLGNQKDTRRNDAFVSRGWLVLRFSEEQVLTHPKSCCKKIAEVVSEFSGEMSSVLKNEKDLTPIPQWTEQEAKSMARQQSRAKRCS